MYYKSLIQDIKDGINKQLRCEIIDETIIEDKYFFKIYLKPDDVLICPQCHSHDIMLFGKKTRNFVDEYYYDKIDINKTHKVSFLSVYKVFFIC